MQAIVLAGGMGRHIKSELGNAPKPMAIINARPFLEFVILFLKKNMVDDIVISGGYMRPVIESFFGDGSEWGIRISYTSEDFLRGTAGSIKLAEDHIMEETFLVLNGDTFYDVEVYDLIEFHYRHEAFVTMALKESDSPERYGAVELLSNGQISRFLDRGHKDGSNLVNSGIYVFDRKVLNFILPNENISLENDIFPSLAKLGKLYGFVTQGFFLDVEIPESYQLIKTKLKQYIEEKA